jgi:hypothetical protein
MDTDTVYPVAKRSLMLPFWLKVISVVYLSILIPVYGWAYDSQQFLWFSNVAFLLTAVAVLKESSLLASMMAVGVIVLELAWNIGFFAALFFGIDPIPGTAYMFDSSIPLFLRLLSLYHVPLPFLLLWLVHRLGYDPRALGLQTLLGWTVLLVCFFFTAESRNINGVHSYQHFEFVSIPPALWLLFLLTASPVAIYWPTHCFLKRWFGGKPGAPYCPK